jgi:DNA-binding transcriptional ArsR family regulator
MARKKADFNVFTAVADPTRRAILDLLLVIPGQSMGEIAAHFAMSQPAVSQHLRVLRDAGLVSRETFGRERRYQLEPLPLAAIAAWIHPYEQEWGRALRRHEASRRTRKPKRKPKR